ncbi:hypothetical protein BDW42DRAFT_181185 [Aspergillus taichungensis]|uniref:Uncharacterized protein n=1 Tax=Aspergillus taichungensis TaxID=482145 RepID=A0A2J5HE69_9EURO|nr:hypothetical protein BDW42DRAFT_181185 [Aspergillus taichungensis]
MPRGTDRLEWMGGERKRVLNTESSRGVSSGGTVSERLIWRYQLGLMCPNGCSVDVDHHRKGDEAETQRNKDLPIHFGVGFGAW